MSSQNSKCLLITTHHMPLVGGALTVYDAIARHSAGRIDLLTARRHGPKQKEVQGWQEFDAQAGYKIFRINETRVWGGASLLRHPLRWLKLSFHERLVKKRLIEEIEKRIATGEYSTICIGDLMQLGWLALERNRFPGMRFIHFIHGEEVSQAMYSERMEKARAAYLQAVDGFIAVSSFTADILAHRYGLSPDTIYLSTNGVNLSVFKGGSTEASLNGLSFPPSPVVFSCGRLVERKGFDKLVEAWPLVLKSIPDAKLVIGGDGELLSQLKDRVASLNIGKSVRFTGRLTQKQLAAAYEKADVFTMPNRTMADGDTEGFGLVFIEAAVMGTPSVGGRAGGAVDAIQHGKTGFLVDGYNIEEITDALVTLLEDKALRHKMGVEAKAYALTQGWENKMQGMLRFVFAEAV